MARHVRQSRRGANCRYARSPMKHISGSKPVANRPRGDWKLFQVFHFERKGTIMSKLHRLLLCPALAMACIVLAVPAAAQIGVVPDHFADESATPPTPPAMTELQDQNTAPRQEPANKYTADSGDKQPVSAVSSH